MEGTTFARAAIVGRLQRSGSLKLTPSRVRKDAVPAKRQERSRDYPEPRGDRCDERGSTRSLPGNLVKREHNAHTLHCGREHNDGADRADDCQ